MEKLIISRKIIIGIIGLLCLYLIYYFPVQRCLANINFLAYIKLQGVKEDNIKNKEILKDYKQDGYYIDIVYKDDPDWTYSYKFSIDELSKCFSYKSINCNIYNEKNESFELSGGRNAVKYPPLEE